MRQSSEEREAKHRAELLARQEEATKQQLAAQAKDEELRRLEAAVAVVTGAVLMMGGEVEPRSVRARAPSGRSPARSGHRWRRPDAASR